MKFGPRLQGDPLFCHAELPAGWHKEATDHSMWSNLVDDKGRIRAKIFYKAAFYDRDAFTRLCCRFSVAYNYDREEHGVAVARVMDGAVVIHETESLALPSEKGREFYAIGDAAKDAACKWLDEHYPDWKSTGAYWD